MSTKSDWLDFQIRQYNLMGEQRKKYYEKALLQIQEIMSTLTEQFLELFTILMDMPYK